MNTPELVVEGRHFPAKPSCYALAFAQHLADDTEREVVVFEQTPGGPKVTRDRVKPMWKPGAKL